MAVRQAPRTCPPQAVLWTVGGGGEGGLYCLSLPPRLPGRAALTAEPENPSRLSGPVVTGCCCFLMVSRGISLVEPLGCLGFLEWLHLGHNLLACLSLDFFATLGFVLRLGRSHNLPVTQIPAACGAWETWSSWT